MAFMNLINPIENPIIFVPIILALLFLIIWRKWFNVSVGAKKSTSAMWFIAILFVGGLYIAGVFSGWGLTAPFATVITTTPTEGVKQDVTPPSGTKVELCTVEDITLKLLSQNMFKKGTAPTGGGQNKVLLSDNKGGWSDLGYIADSGTTTIPVNTDLRILFHVNSTSGSTGVYGKELLINSGCSDPLIVTGQVAQYDTSPIFTIFNENGQPLSATVTQDMGADGKYDLDYKLKASANTAIGNPNEPEKGNLFCLQYNTTEYSKAEITGALLGYVPQGLTAKAGHSASCYFIPVVSQKTNQEISGSINIETASGYIANSNISTSIWDTNFDFDADTLETVKGLQDEDNNDLGYSNNITGNFIYIS